jgi:replicative superfamily II helicase
MKTLRDCIRFIAVSATIPNVNDISTWLSSNNNKAITKYGRYWLYDTNVLITTLQGYLARNIGL